MRNRNPNAVRRGFTLLEVILALGLTVILLSLISFATSTFWRAHRRGHAAVENAQLARALLARIANDLRATIVVLPESASRGAAGLDPFASATSGGAAAVDPMESAAAAEGAVGDAETPLGARPGIYGNAFALQLDVCRAMRSDEFLLASASPGYSGLPLGVTTVSYFVAQNLGPAPALPTGAAGSLSPGAAPTGLVRRVVNRSLAGASQAGLMTFGAPPQRVELLAPEVVGLQFRYFDGYQWFLAWDSELMQASPVAVEILLTLRKDDARPSSPNASPSTATPAALEQYRLVVHLPVSAPMQDATLSADPLTTGGL